MENSNTKTFISTFMYIKKILLVIGLLLVIAGGIFSYHTYQRVFAPNTAFETNTKTLFIKTGASFNDVKKQITPFVKEVEWFTWLAQKKGYATNVKPGKYILKKGSNSNDIIGVLRIQNTPVTLRFNNQERLENLAGRISYQIEADSIAILEEFRKVDFLKEKGLTLNTALSMFIPNSYKVYWNISPEQLKIKLYNEQQRFWNKKRLSKAKEIGLSKTEVYTLAAIVHKETAKVSERPKVAGVYMNRLKRNMRLDADPTVIYAVKKFLGNWDRVIKRVLFKDLALKHPYNTYQNNGLPPGPITMPDISAIDAVLNYERHKYLYFVADVQNFGYHKFATNLKQHNRNSAQYHQWVNKNHILR